MIVVDAKTNIDDFLTDSSKPQSIHVYFKKQTNEAYSGKFFVKVHNSLLKLVPVPKDQEVNVNFTLNMKLGEYGAQSYTVEETGKTLFSKRLKDGTILLGKKLPYQYVYEGKKLVTRPNPDFNCSLNRPVLNRIKDFFTNTEKYFS